MNQIKNAYLSFQAQTLHRRLSLAGGVLFIVIFTFSLMIWVISPNYGLLFSQLDNQVASQILNQLEKDNIAYKVQNQGKDILIENQLVDKTRIKLMGHDLQFTNNVGFELFDKTDFGMTDFSQKINYQRALQGELERTINSLDEVKQARVQLTIPERHLFEDAQDLPRAAVTLHLNQSLTSAQVKSIQQLITASVANLPANNVVIVDQHGNGLIAEDNDNATNHFTAKKNIERYLNEKVMQMLNQVFDDERVLVKIDATLNFDELTLQRIKPQQAGLITHEKETRHDTPNKNGKAPINQDFTREKSYEFGREKKQFTRANGTIQRLTISVVLPQKTTQNKINQIERLVKSVVGFDDKRGDKISVEALIETKVSQPARVMIPHKKAPFSKINGLPVLFIVLSLLSLVTLRYLLKRFRQRRVLLNELCQWLLEHE